MPASWAVSGDTVTLTVDHRDLAWTYPIYVELTFTSPDETTTSESLLTYDPSFADVVAAPESDEASIRVDAACGRYMPADSPENFEVIESALRSAQVAGGSGGAAVGTQDNPLPLPAEYTPPPNAKQP